jgi:hypothetical protein
VNLAEQEVNMVKIDVIEILFFIKFYDPHKVEHVRKHTNRTIAYSYAGEEISTTRINVPGMGM